MPIMEGPYQGGQPDSVVHVEACISSCKTWHPTLFKLWNRTKLAIDKPSNPTSNVETRPYHLDDEEIELISPALADARAGHAPRRINNHYNGDKAAEWEAWLKFVWRTVIGPAIR
jgi:hypothetical protein